MGFFAWIILGLIAGAIAKAIMPGKQGGGILVTLLLGVVGAVLGGWLGSLIFDKPLGTFWNLWTWLVSIVGALIVLWIWGAITKKKNQ
ncbi:GlsB/YeaQ/YmgE family stress response membrane protein [Cutibacterium sp. V947]|uniref:GlsB/YeaQ/YmgE family stress response membrane protein n=1 Tax=unclassified Cutibacterium TaxID=2649671 RepID=UPI003EE30F65